MLTGVTVEYMYYYLEGGFSSQVPLIMSFKSFSSISQDHFSRIVTSIGVLIFVQPYKSFFHVIKVSGALCSCGAMTHDAKSCMDRPRRVGAKWNGKHIAPDEIIEEFELDFDGKRDRWNGFQAESYALVVHRYEAQEEARRKHLKEQQLKKLEEKNKTGEDGGASDDDDDEDDVDALKVDEALVDESKQMDFAKVEKRVRTTGGGSTGTVR